MPDTNPRRLELQILADRLAICRLDPSSPIPAWAEGGGFASITRTADELSVVCAEAAAPDSVRAERGWRLLRVAGTQEFTLVGVLAGLVGPLARAGVGLFSVSTFDTDYLLVKEADLARAAAALVAAGHAVAPPPPPDRP